MAPRKFASAIAMANCKKLSEYNVLWITIILLQITINYI